MSPYKNLSFSNNLILQFHLPIFILNSWRIENSVPLIFELIMKHESTLHVLTRVQIKCILLHLIFVFVDTMESTNINSGEKQIRVLSTALHGL